MGVKYRHLTEQDRIFLRLMLEKRYPKTKIAHIFKIAVHIGTVGKHYWIQKELFLKYMRDVHENKPY